MADYQISHRTKVVGDVHDYAVVLAQAVTPVTIDVEPLWIENSLERGIYEVISVPRGGYLGFTWIPNRVPMTTLIFNTVILFYGFAEESDLDVFKRDPRNVAILRRTRDL